MPGFLGGSSGGGGGTGGEIRFPKEFIDPVTKFRVSNPENLIDTDFEYGLQPTKWETVELINNIPSFFSKSGDTTIPNIISINTIQGSREVTVTTSLDHGLSVGTPINVSGTKALTADGAYIINSVPTSRTFTYLARENQFFTQSIEDLYSAIITGEFFQGSQIRISDSDGLVTDGGSPSTLTVKTESPHGFGVNTPFYFLNLNSTISQEFDSTNTEAKTFDSSNSSTARTFDGSNTVTSTNYDFSNRAASSPDSVGSQVAGVNTVEDTITVTHTSENFQNLTLGTPLFYKVTSSSGYFFSNPRGVVFLKTTDGLGASNSTFQVSEVPNGNAIDIVANISGFFQVADLVASFAGSNEDVNNQVSVDLFKGTTHSFDGDNSEGSTYTVSGYSGLGNITLTEPTNWLEGQMVFYSTDGTPATGLTNNTTYWVTATNPSTTIINVAPEPGGTTITSISGGTGTQTFSGISVSLDRNVVAVPGHDFLEADMVLYSFPTDEPIQVGGSDAGSYYYVERVFDDTHISLTNVKGFTLDGSTQARAALSAQAIKEINPSATSGAYWIKPEGSSTAHLTYCDFDLNDGGWTLIMKLGSSTLLTNSLPGGVAGQVGASYTFGPHWDGWLWNSDSQFDTLFNSANAATLADNDAFSPLFYKLPFNDVMVVSLDNTANRVAWRHNATISNMRAVTGGTSLPTVGDEWLQPPGVSQDEYSWVRRLSVHTGVRNFVLQAGTPRFGFKILSDYANNYGNVNSFLTGGYDVTGSSNVTGHGVAMIGVGGTGTSSNRWGGGIGFTYTSNSPWRAHGHFWGFGTSSGATANRSFISLAVLVR